MFEGSQISRKQLPPKPQGSRDMQVLRSIQAHSALSLDQGEPQQLMMRLLLLSIEIDRKDTIIRELMDASSGEQARRIIEQLSLRCNKYQIQVKTLSETVAMLKQNISSIQSNKNRQLFTSITQFNEQLQAKVATLQSKLRRTQEQKIDLQEQIKQNKVNQTLAEFNFFKNQHNEKGRVRELENLLASERARGETERRALSEKNLLLEEMKAKIIQFQNREKLIISQYEQKLRSFHNQMVFHDNLKKSQIMSTEERLNATSQQIASLTEEIRYLKQTNDQLREIAQAKEKQLHRITSQYRVVETKLIKTESQLRDITIRLQTKMQQLKSKELQYSEKAANNQRLMSQIDQLRFTFASKGHQAQLYSDEASRLKSEIVQLQSQLESQRLQIRRLKKKPLTQSTLCEGCRARQMASSGLIASQKSIKGVNISEIIDQTQQLFRSNRKIQSIINRHDSFIQSSIHMYNTRTGEL